MQTQNQTVGQPSGVPTRTGGRTFLRSSLILLYLLLAVVVTVLQLQPPSPKPTSAPATDFSAERAMAHIQAIASTPHPGGSAEHQKVQAYIMDQIKQMGLTPDLQKATSTYQYSNTDFDRVSSVENIVVRLTGTGQNHQQAVLLAAGYDSIANSNGAGKNGVAVASLLETMRALQKSGPLANDVIFVFTDQSQYFWMGSSAFVDQHPWVKDVKVFFNFESRGSSGPVYLFETTPNNGWLVQEFAKAVPDPFANSLFYFVYKQLAYDTDFTHYKRIPGAEGLNFAFFEDPNYHTANDTIANLDQRSLQHNGDYALGLARHFGNMSSLAHPPTNDSVFFMVGSLFFVHYSVSWVLATTALVVLLFAAVLLYGLRKKHVSIGRLLLGLLVFLLMIVAAAGAAQGLFMGLNMLVDVYDWQSHANLFVIGFVLIAMAICAALFAGFRRKLPTSALAMGAATFWLLLAVATAFVLPDGNFLFTWPLFFALLVQGYVWRAGEARTPLFWIIVCVLLLPTIVLMVQMIQLLFTVLGLGMPAVLVLLCVLLIGLLLPLFDLMIPKQTRYVPLSFTAVGVVLVALATLLPAYSTAAPKPNTLWYAENLDTGKSYFATKMIESVDSYTAPYVGSGTPNDFSQFYPEIHQDWVRLQDAKVATVASPVASVISDKTEGDVRTLHLKMGENKRLLNTYLSFTSDQPLVKAQYNDRDITNRNQDPKKWFLYYTNPPQAGYDLTLFLKKDQKVTIRVTDASLGFPADLNVAKRPSSYVPTYFSDITYVTKTFTF